MTTATRTVLITGAASGLGRGVSLYLAKKGHAILAADLNLKGAQETASQIGAAGGKASAFALDVTSEESVQQLIKQSGDRSIDVLVNNAGLQHVSKLEEF